MSNVYCQNTYTFVEGISKVLVFSLKFTCCHITCVAYAGCFSFEILYTNSQRKATSPQLYYLLSHQPDSDTFPVPIAIEKQCFTPRGVSRYCLVYSILNCNLVCKKTTTKKQKKNKMVMHVNKAYWISGLVYRFRFFFLYGTVTE